MSVHPATGDGMLGHALDYAGRGLCVFPCAADKKPLTAHGLKDATTDPDKIRAWWTRNPQALIGAAMGEASGVFAVDPDAQRTPETPDGVGAWQQLKASHGEHAATHSHLTPSGGMHILFRWNASHPVSNSKGSLPAGIDVRGQGGYVIMAPSQLPDGRKYELAESFDFGHFAEAPPWLFDLIERKPEKGGSPRKEAAAPVPKGSHERYVAAALEKECERVSAATSGGRNNTLNEAAFALGTIVGARHLDAGFAADQLFNAAQSCGLVKEDGFRAVMATIESGLTAGAQRPREMPEARAVSQTRPGANDNASRNTHEVRRERTQEDTPSWPAPKPIPMGLAPVMAFDKDMVPAAIGPWVMDIADRMQCPPDFVGVSAMVGLATVLGRKLAIKPQRQTDWMEVPNLWGCIVGRPGAMKSPAMEEALKPLKRLETEARKANEESLARFAKTVAIHKIKTEAAQARAKKILAQNVHGDVSEILDGMEPPEPPQAKRFVTNDSTYEKLGEILAHNPNGILVFRDELVSLLRQLDREEAAAARSFYLTCWGGKSSYTFDRIVRGISHIDAACISVLGSTQPGKLAEYLRRAVAGGAGDDGLIQRFALLVWPDDNGSWKEVDRYPDREAKEAAWACFNRLEHLTSDDVGAECDTFDSIPHLRLEEAARDVFRDWRKDFEERMKGGTLHAALESHFSKYRKLVPALALINHVADGGRGPIEKGAMFKALAFAEYLETHAKRAYGSGTHTESAMAKAILKHIQKGDLGHEFSIRDILQKDWSNLTDKEQVTAGADLLDDLGWVASMKLPTSGRPKFVYRVNPRGAQ